MFKLMTLLAVLMAATFPSPDYTCSRCGGSGTVSGGKTCPICGGSGQHR